MHLIASVENRPGQARHLQTVLDVAAGFLLRQPFQRILESKPLIQRLETGDFQP